MQIANDVALNQAGLRRRWRRIGARVLRLAVAVGLLGSVFTFPIVFWVSFSAGMVLYASSTLERTIFLLVFVAVLAALYVLIALLSSRKTPVLYLRRFGLSGANRMITKAIEGGLGRHYRVLTLDDSSFKPLEVPRIERILSRIGIPMVVMLFLVTLSSFGFLGLPYTLQAILFLVFPFAYGYGGIVLLPLLLMLMPIVVAILVYRWRIRQSFKLEIGSAEEIHRCLIRVQGLAGWLRRPSLIAPQALVVKVIDKLWQDAVSQLADGVRLVICDVSEPTNNLIWEVERMSARPEVTCLFVGNGPMVRRWVQETVDAGAETPSSRMKSLLQEQTILVFDPTRHFAQRSFNRNLRNSLDNLMDTIGRRVSHIREMG